MWNLIIFGEQYGSYEDMSVLFRTTCTGGGTASASRTWGRPQSSSGRAPPLSLLFFLDRRPVFRVRIEFVRYRYLFALWIWIRIRNTVPDPGT